MEPLLLTLGGGFSAATLLFVAINRKWKIVSQGFSKVEPASVLRVTGEYDGI